MKKVYLTGLLLIFINLINAQITVFDVNGNVIEDGSIFEFNEVDPDGFVQEPVAKLSYYIQNNTSTEIHVKAAIIEIEGADGSNVQFCMENCLYNISENSVVPNATGAGFSIAAGATTGPGIYFWNFNNSSDYISYKFKVFQVDGSGNEIGTPIHINYVYNATASTPNMTLQKLGVQVNNTLVNNEFTFTTNSAMAMNLFDINGRNVASQNVNEGTNLYKASELNAGIYIAKFTDKQGQTASIKIVKQ